MGDSNQLFESLFRPKIGQEGEVDFLKQLTSEHPYFSPAQFFLLQRTNETDADFAHQAARTAVLFNNPFWLNFQLLEAQEKLAEINEIESLPQPEIDHEDSTGQKIAEQEKSIEPATTIERGIEVQDTESTFVDDYPEVETALVPPTLEEAQSTLAPAPREPGSPESTVDDVAAPSEMNGAPSADEEPALDPEEQKELEPLHVRLNIVEPTTTEETISFEPLHTTDYFASQGIRLSNDVKSTDKLGKQLKSFTEWLKTMKKIHAEQPADSVNQTDVTIQKLAEKSNDEDEVVTEAMADVLIQQGKGGKAREVYRKLSLLNPAKTAYFAAKIDQLKEQ